MLERTAGVACSWNVQYEERRAEDDDRDVDLAKVMQVLKSRVKELDFFQMLRNSE